MPSLSLLAIISTLLAAFAAARPFRLPSTEPRHYFSKRQSASPSFTVGSQGAVSQKAAAARLPVLATDGSTIVAMEAQISGIALQFRISGPPASLLAAAVKGATLQPLAAATTTTPPDARANSTSDTVSGSTTSLTPFTGTFKDVGPAKPDARNRQRQALPGINVLLHGDGGQSFSDFPNQAVQGNLLGVVVLAPNDQAFWGGGAGLQRTDGVLHSQLVNTLITQVLPQVMSFDPSQVFLTGVSGGSLLLSGFYLPAFAETTKTAALLMCGGLAPQVKGSANFGATLATMKIHFQSSTDELADLKVSIPQSTAAFKAAALAGGGTAASLATTMTFDKTPTGGHCEFDGKGFVSGIQLVANNYNAIFNGDGNVPGIGKVTTPV